MASPTTPRSSTSASRPDWWRSPPRSSEASATSTAPRSAAWCSVSSGRCGTGTSTRPGPTSSCLPSSSSSWCSVPPASSGCGCQRSERVEMIGWFRRVWETDPRKDPNSVVYFALGFFALTFPLIANVISGGRPNFWLSVAGDAGVYMLLTLGLNVVVGMAGLLDLGYAAFFAIGAYTYAFIASDHLAVTPLATTLHVPFWIVLIIALFVAASFGVVLGAPTLRLRGDYLAIVTLGFGEIVPRVFKNASTWTSGVNGISALDTPMLPFWLQGPWSGDPLQVVQNFKIFDPLAYYVIMVVLLVICVVLVRNL